MAESTAIRAGIWSTVDLCVRLGIHFVVSVILARLLTPTDFGIFALVMFFVAISQVLVDRGLSTALIQSQTDSPEQQTALFWWTMIVACVLSAIIAVIAPVFAQYFGYPVLKPLLYVCAVIVPTSAFASVPTALLQRRLRFDIVAKSGIIASVLSATASVTSAVYGAGVWSFAVQAVIYSVTNSCLIWIIGNWSPLQKMHLGAAKKLIHFGSLVTFASLLDVIYTNGTSLIIGRLHGARDLGFFNRAQNLQNLPGNILAAIVTRVALPLFSAKQGDDASLMNGMRIVQGAIMLINLPLMAALAVLPDLVINFLYGPKWVSVAPILAILSIGGILFPLQVVNAQLIISQGRSGLSLKIEVSKKIIGLLLLLIGSRYGLNGLAVGQAVSVYLGFFINAVIVGRMIGYGLFRQIRDLFGVAIITIIMAGVMVAVRPMLALGDTVDLIALTSIGGIFFVALVVLLRISVIEDLIAMTPLQRFSHRIPALVKHSG